MRALGLTMVTLLLIVPVARSAPHEESGLRPGRRPTVTASGQKRPSALASKPMLFVLTAGNDPKQLLRYAFPKGHQATFTMVISLTARISMDKTTLAPIEVPPVRMLVSVGVAEVDADGNMKLSLIVKSAVLSGKRGNPLVRRLLLGQITRLAGIKGWSLITPRGEVKKSDFELPEAAAPQLKQLLKGLEDSMRQLTPPLPEEKVGIGAKWRVIWQVTSNGVPIRQQAQYTLTELKGDKIGLASTLTQHATPQMMRIGGMPKDATAQLKSLSSNGTSVGEFHLTKLEQECTATLFSRILMGVSLARRSREMLTEMQMKVVVSAR